MENSESEKLKKNRKLENSIKNQNSKNVKFEKQNFENLNIRKIEKFEKVEGIFFLLDSCTRLVGAPGNTDLGGNSTFSSLATISNGSSGFKCDINVKNFSTLATEF